MIAGAATAATGVGGISAVGAEEWNRLVAPGQRPLLRDHLAAWEHAQLDGLESRPLTWRVGGRLVAGAPAFVYDLDLAGVRAPALARPLLATRRILPRLLVARMFEVGSSTPLVSPILVEGAGGREAAAAALADAAQDEAARCRASMVVVQNFVSSRSPVDPVFRAAGFTPVPIPPTVVVDLPFHSFDEYLQAMRAQYRRRYRQAMTRSRGLGLEQRRDFADLAPELARLWRRVYDRASDVKREILPTGYFRRASALDETSVLLLRRDNGSIASFALLLADEPVLHFLHCGFEERAGREEGAYFRLLYEIVRAAIDGGFERANLGMTTLEPKLDIGGTCVPLWAWLHHRSARVQHVFAALASGPFAPKLPQARRVFNS